MSGPGGIYIHRETLDRHEIARNLTAAASLVHDGSTTHDGAALVHIGLALLKLCKLDTEQKARAYAEQFIRESAR